MGYGSCTLLVMSSWRNLMSFVFGLLKMSFWVPKKRSPVIFGKAIRPKGFREMGKKALINSRILKFPWNNRTDNFFLAQPKSNPQSCKSTPDSLEQRLKAFKRKRSFVPLKRFYINTSKRVSNSFSSLSHIRNFFFPVLSPASMI